ncbi:bifunctional helix-turn-helix transcriptional regulator/GNAT family N-acetyltransferase [Pinisolibacter sp.]|uniref:bifunctional helix-turn-helix transcriptional regulator/GNAT family N-acetyltransferase n=1 Tax=Pinisolibacter sp. TaxID=2172024 RepID=UPI002FDD9425
MTDDGRHSATNEAAVERVRAFNRFYTRRLDLLDRGFLASPFTLGEVRLLWELAHRDGIAAADLSRDLGIDPGQLSRTLKRFTTAGLIERQADTGDARRSAVVLTDHGRTVFAPLEAEQCRRVAAGLGELSPEAVTRLVGAMADVERLLDPAAVGPLVIRPHRTGDVAFVLARQARLYAEDFGFDQRFEALICEVGAAFLRDYDPRRDASFVAEIDGRIVGAVFVTRKDDAVARLRLLHVESEMRGRGIGTRLIDACIHFVRDAGYRTLTLWTNDVLAEARRLYERAGFRLVAAEPHTMFGPPLVGETWDLTL